MISTLSRQGGRRYPQMGLGTSSQTKSMFAVGVFSVGISPQSLWNVRSCVGQAEQSIWNAMKSVLASSQEVWGVRAVSAADCNAKWNARSTIRDSLSGGWNTRTSISTTLQEVWSVREIAKLLCQNLWNSRSVVRGVDVHEIWNTYEIVYVAVAKAESFVWDTRKSVSDSFQLEFDTRTPVGLAAEALWDVLLSCSRENVALWGTNQAVSKQAQLVWNTSPLVRAFINMVLTIRQAYGVSSQIRREFQGGADIRQSLVEDMALGMITTRDADIT